MDLYGGRIQTAPLKSIKIEQQISVLRLIRKSTNSASLYSIVKLSNNSDITGLQNHIILDQAKILYFVSYKHGQ